MSTTTERQVVEESRGAMELSPVLSARFALSWKQLLVCAWFAAFFMYFNYIPIFHSDIWGHIHYGKFALEHGHFPAHDPFMPLAAGMTAVNTAWLSQIVFAQVESWGGPQFVSNLFAIAGLATYVIYGRVFFVLTRRLSMVVLGTGLILLVGWSRHAIVRPETFGALCFAVLIWMVIQGEPWRSRRPGRRSDSAAPARLPWAVWIGVPVLFALWANLHGSFLVGLAVLGCHALGRVIEVGWRSRRFSAVLADGWVRRWAVLTELAVLATLLNPVGVDLLIESIRFGQNPNLRDVLEWFPLKADSFEGIQFGVTMIIMLFVLRLSRRRLAPVDALLLLVFGLALCPTIRMIGWWAPVFTLTMMPHLSHLWSRVWRSKETAPADQGAAAGEQEEEPDPEKPLTPAHFLPSLIALLVVWTAFALSPVSQPLLSNKPRELEQIVHRGTPLGVTAWLRENPPEKLVFGPQWWGDWLCWDGPPGLQVFMTTHIHLAPRQVWRDYLRIARADAGWEQALQRYDIDLVIVDKELQKGFTSRVRRSPQWRTVFEDERSMILTRRERR
ncbi:MAG: hypothetical protein RIC55_26010 [Pirellulaceae bacterium]